MVAEQLDTLIQSLGIEYQATFVPQSRSRNANEKSPTLNWKITLQRGNYKLETDYSQGIGHHPKYRQRTPTVYDQNVYKRSCENGKYSVGGWAERPLPAPKLVDVLHSLVLDSDVLEYPCFEDWAESFGYDTNSRKAEATYRSCLEIALKMRLILSDRLPELQEAYADY